MKTKQIILWTAITILLAQMACQNPVETPGGGTTERKTSVSGTVVRKDDPRIAVGGALVRDLTGNFTTADSAGRYSLSYNVSGSLNVSLYASKALFKSSDTLNIRLTEGKDTTGINLLLDTTASSPKAGALGGSPASITMVKVDGERNLALRGTGFNQSVTATFEVRDSSNKAITGIKVPIKFSLSPSLGGGEFVKPLIDSTDPGTGQIQATVNTGTKRGVVLLYATTRNDSVVASPVSITISGGLPVATNSSMTVEKVNIPGLVTPNLRSSVTVFLGDRYRNPVPAGTPVSFSTTAGLITATGITDKDGLASAMLVTDSSKPAGGNVLVTAQVNGDTSGGNRIDSLITMRATLLFSGKTVVNVLPFPAPSPNVLLIPDSGEVSFSYRLWDANRNPMAAGTQVKVTAAGAGAGSLTLSGDVNFTTIDTRDTAQTLKKVTVLKTSRAATGGGIVFSIEVQGPNNPEKTLVVSFNGDAGSTSGGGGGPIGGAVGTPYSISLSGAPVEEIMVNESGGSSSSSTPVSFVVRDSLGNALTSSVFNNRKAYVMFSLRRVDGTTLDESVFPAADSTSTSGLVTAVVTSGTKAGLVRLTATLVRPGKPSTSTDFDVRITGGYPDPTNISLGMTKFNVPGRVTLGKLTDVGIQLGDRFGNPARRSLVYFSTTGGTIESGEGKSTDALGTVSVSLLGGNPIPVNGRGIITARLFGKDSVAIQKTIPFISSGPTRISLSGTNVYTIADSSFRIFGFTVADDNGNPLAEGTTITVTKDGDAVEDIQLTGDVNVSVPDVKDTTAATRNRYTSYTFTALDKTKGGKNGTGKLIITVTSPNGNLSQPFDITTSPAGGGGGGPVAGAVGRPNSIAVVGTPVTEITVSESGNSPNSTTAVTFAVKDSVGNPIFFPNSTFGRAYVTFALRRVDGTTLDETVFPSADSTNANGQVTVAVNAGTKSGLVRLTATTLVSGKPAITTDMDIRISGGYPDSNNISLGLSKFNVPGIVTMGKLTDVGIQVGDKFGNPARRSLVYFSTTGGTIESGEGKSTDAVGSMSVSLQGGNPIPPGGFGTITARLFGKDSTQIRKTVLFITSGAPVITADPLNNTTVQDSGRQDLTFFVADANGNPMVEGTTITVTKEGTALEDAELTGEVTKTMNDTRDTSYAVRRLASRIQFRITDKTRGGKSGSGFVNINVTGPNGTAKLVVAITQLVTGGGPVGSLTGRAVATLELATPAQMQVSLKGTGTGEQATVTFTAKDSSNAPVGLAKRAYVVFSTVSNLAAGQAGYLSPLADSTDENGQVSTTFHAGTAPGVVQIIARTRPAGRPDSIESAPVRLTVSGGFPDPNRIFAKLSKENITGFKGSDVTSTLSVTVADTNGNPVQPTALSYTTSLGTITSSSITNESGIATATLSGGGVGDGAIIIRTVGSNHQLIQKTVPFIFSGPAKIKLPAGGFQIQDSSSYSFSFKVSDSLGNPLSASTNIKVTLSGAGSADLVMDRSDFTLPDTRDTNLTNYTVRLSDTKSRGAVGPVTVKITVASDNGNVEGQFEGEQLTSGTIAGGTTGRIASIGVSSAPTSNIFVRGSGNVTTAAIVFVARDSAGVPVDINRRAYMKFSIAPTGGLGGGEYLYPVGDSTDANGQVTTTFNAGSVAGIVQVNARAWIAGRPVGDSIQAVQTITISRGLPDSAGFSAALSRTNLPGLAQTVQSGTDQIGSVTVNLSDKFGNPVPAGTQVDFQSYGGIIDPNGKSDENGKVVAKFSRGGRMPDTPSVGYGYIIARTIGDQNRYLTKRLNFLFSGSPQVVASSDTLPVINEGSYIDVPFKVYDQNKRPISAGNRISVTVGGDAANEIMVLGASFITPETQDTVNGVGYKFQLKHDPKGLNLSGQFRVEIKVEGESGTYTKILVGSLVRSGSGIASNIALASSDLDAVVPRRTLSVKGTGGVETAKLTFIVKDPTGNAIDNTNKVWVKFILLPGSPAGATMSTNSGDSAQTDAAGRVIATLNAGTKPGVAMVQASISGTSITSQSSQFSIVGGLPDSAYFSIYPTDLSGVSKRNYPGMTTNNQIGTVRVQLGDRYGNPPPTNTQVQFQMPYGGFISGSRATDADGIVIATMFGGVEPNGPEGKGYTYVIVSTGGANNKVLRDSVRLLWTGAARIVFTDTNVINPTTLALKQPLADGGSVNIDFKLVDKNGRQVARNNSVLVTVTGDVGTTLGRSGNFDFTTIDDTVNVSYRATIRDVNPNDATNGSFNINVTSNGDNGAAVAVVTGTLQPAPPGPIAKIVAPILQTNEISVLNSGGTESMFLTFSLRDSLDRPVDLARRDTVTFIVTGPGGGEAVSPTRVISDANGLVTTLLTAGTKSGTVQVVAVDTLGTQVIKSSTLTFTITGGSPAVSKSVVNLSRLNMPGLVRPGDLVGTVSVQLADTNGNPVRVNTPVYFTSTGGSIEASASTGPSGTAVASVFAGSAPNPPNGGDGFGLISVRTNGLNGSTVTLPSKRVLFSGKADSVVVASSSLSLNASKDSLASTLSDGGSWTLGYKIKDANGRPLSNGNRVTVSISGPGSASLQVSGNTIFNIADDTTLATYQVVVRDETVNGGSSGAFTLTISVAGESGDLTKTISGRLASPNAGPPSFVTLSTISDNSIVTSGTGGLDYSTLTFIVRDSLGAPIDQTQQVYVRFTKIGPAGGETFSADSARTSNEGVVTTRLIAGTKAGTVQVIASVQLAGRTIQSLPSLITITGGSPDSTKIVLTQTRQNYPGLVKVGEPVGQVTIQLSDAYGNPVKPGTLVHFASDGGAVDASSVTNSAGVATATLYGGLAPNVSALGGVGFGYVSTKVYAANNVPVIRNSAFLFSGAPVITVPAVSNDTLTTITDGGSLTVAFKVKDQNGRPLSSSNNVTVSVAGTASSALLLSGNTNFQIRDTQDTTAGVNYSFKIEDQIANGGVGGTIVVTITVNGESGSYTKTLYGSLSSPSASSTSSGYASNIELVSTSRSSISVRGTGLPETSVLIWQLRDSLGNAVSLSRKAMVRFTIQGGPGGTASTQPFLTPDSSYTDDFGRVSATFNAGTIAGVAQVVATATVNGRTLTSSPVAMTIFGGLPDSNRITVWTDLANMTGNVAQGNKVGTVFVQLGDRYNNPVPPNTAVYFTTTGGLIDASAYTDASGHASVNIYGGNPPPVNGRDTISITTVVQGGVSVTRKVEVIFSGVPVVTRTGVVTQQDTVSIADGSSADIPFSVKDANGNPLAAGNTITVTVSGIAGSGIVPSGDVSVSTFDTKTTGNGRTDFSVRLSDAVSSGGVSGIFLVKIAVSGSNVPAGIQNVLYQFYGNLLSPQSVTPPSPTVRQPAQIAFIGVSATDLFVSGVGALENSVVTYEVRDSLGSPIDKSQRSFATYTIQFFPNSSVSQGPNATPKVIPGSDSTSDVGRLQVSVLSGTQSGVVQLITQINLGGGKIIKSQPVRITVHAGFPEQKHFTLASSAYNFPGLQKYFLRQKITAQVADKFSNPVQAGTAVYFNSLNGSIQTGGTAGLTDADGFVSADLISSNPLPKPPDTLSFALPSPYNTSDKRGWSQVYARTLGDSTSIVDSLLILWTGAPIIDTTGSSAPHSFGLLATGASAGPWVFKVKDLYGHPMSAGTTVTVTAGTAQVDGDANSTIGDNLLTGGGVTDFLVSITNPNTSATKTSSIIVMVTVSHPTYGTYTRILATGSMQVP